MSWANKVNTDALNKAKENKTGKVQKFKKSVLIPEGERTLKIIDAKESTKGKGFTLYFEDTKIDNAKTFFYIGYENDNQLAVMMTIADEINLNIDTSEELKDFVGGTFKAIIEHNTDGVIYKKDNKTEFKAPKTRIGKTMSDDEAIADGWIIEPKTRAEITEVITSKETNTNNTITETTNDTLIDDDDLI